MFPRIYGVIFMYQLDITVIVSAKFSTMRILVYKIMILISKFSRKMVVILDGYFNVIFD